MKSIFLPILLLLTFSTFAQNHMIGIVGGASWMNVSSNENYLSDNDPRSGFAYGLTYENRLDNHLLIGANLMYYQRGYQDEMPLFIRSNMEPLLHGSYGYHFNYLALPLKWGYIIGDKVSGFANIGLIPSYLVDAKMYLPESNINIFSINSLSSSYSSSNSPQTFREYLTKFDLAGLIEIGTNIKLSNKLLISATVSYQHSITSITNEDYYDEVGMRNYGMVLTGGIKYILKGE